jgi:hypothetical protein
LLLITSQAGRLNSIVEIATIRIGGNTTVNADNTSENPAMRPTTLKKPRTPKKNYTAPAFKFETVFGVAALSCGKIFKNQGFVTSAEKHPKAPE